MSTATVHDVANGDTPDSRHRDGGVLRLWQLSALIIVLGVGCTAALTSWAIHAHGVYWSRVQVRFVAPTGPANPNGLQTSATSLVMTANAVAKMVDDTDRPQLSSPDATLVGEGVRSGWSVEVPNSGGQWTIYYAEPYLDVQAVDPSPAVVERTMRRLVNTIKTDLLELQQAAHVAPTARIQARTLPITTPPIYYETGSRTRAAATSLLLGGAGTLFLSWLVRQLARQVTFRRRRGPQVPGQVVSRPTASPVVRTVNDAGC